MPTGTSLIQIIIPCFNGVRFLRETLESIQAQTHRNFDCLIVDDGSLDSSNLIYKEFTSQDLRFRSIQLDKNYGESAAVNVGWSERKSDLLCVLSCDDPQPNTWLEEMLKFYLKVNDRKVIVVYPNIRVINDIGETIEFRKQPDWSRSTLREDFICVVSAGALVDASKLPKDFLPRIEEIYHPSDFVQYLRISEHGVGIRNPDYCANWRIHGESKTTQVAADEAEAFREGIERYFEMSKIPMSRFQRLSLNCQCLWLKTKGKKPNLASLRKELRALTLGGLSWSPGLFLDLAKVVFRFLGRKAKRIFA